MMQGLATSSRAAAQTSTRSAAEDLDGFAASSRRFLSTRGPGWAPGFPVCPLLDRSRQNGVNESRVLLDRSAHRRGLAHAADARGPAGAQSQQHTGAGHREARRPLQRTATPSTGKPSHAFAAAASMRRLVPCHVAARKTGSALSESIEIAGAG